MMRPKLRRLTDEQSAAVAANIGLAHKLALTQATPGDDRFDTVLSAAFEGLCLAALLFDPSRGVKFSTYAWWSMWSTVVKTMRLDRMIHVPCNSRSGRREDFVAAAERALAMTRITPSRFRCSDDDAGHDFILDTFAIVDDEVTEDFPWLHEAIEALDARGRDIVRRRMAGETLDQIGRDYGICKERVRQIHSTALSTLRTRLIRAGHGVEL